VIDQYDYFFGRRRRDVEQTQSGLGSGVIVSKEGHILTNHHVIAGMDEISVQLTDGRTAVAELIGSDEGVDLAVLRIKEPNLQPLPFGDSDTVNVGQMVFAIGNPFGLQETVTQGIISAKGRAISDSGVELLQTDAAVNPGNSGGPLLNLRGEIIGINSAIYSRTGAWAGISFAIPANTAKQTMEAITQKGDVVRPYLGVVMADVNREFAKQFGLPDARGAIITEVLPGSPAEQCGMAAGDVVRTFNGHVIRDTRELRRRLAATTVGTEVKLVVFRNGSEMTLTARLAEMPSDTSMLRVPPAPSPAQPPPKPRESGNSRRTPNGADNVLSGLTVSEIPDEIRRLLPETIRGGVIITQVDPASPAAGLRVGDIIEEVNQQPVRSVEDYDRLAKGLPPGKRALLFIARGSTRSFVVITP
jgi:serine protease Do